MQQSVNHQDGDRLTEAKKHFGFHASLKKWKQNLHFNVLYFTDCSIFGFHFSPCWHTDTKRPRPFNQIWQTDGETDRWTDGRRAGTGRQRYAEFRPLHVQTLKFSSPGTLCASVIKCSLEPRGVGSANHVVVTAAAGLRHVATPLWAIVAKTPSGALR